MSDTRYSSSKCFSTHMMFSACGKHFTKASPHASLSVISSIYQLYTTCRFSWCRSRADTGASIASSEDGRYGGVARNTVHDIVRCLRLYMNTWGATSRRLHIVSTHDCVRSGIISTFVRSKPKDCSFIERSSHQFLLIARLILYGIIMLH